MGQERVLRWGSVGCEGRWGCWRRKGAGTGGPGSGGADLWVPQRACSSQAAWLVPGLLWSSCPPLAPWPGTGWDELLFCLAGEAAAPHLLEKQSEPHLCLQGLPECPTEMTVASCWRRCSPQSTLL